MPHQPRLIKDEPAVYTVLEADKAVYRERLRQQLQEPAFRQIEGFPIGEDEDILALSDPPYYTACPNPFLPEIIAQWRQERAALRQQLELPDDEQSSIENRQSSNGYQREPFAADVSEGKNDPIYNAHSYHTKVPHKAIMRYILHYTDPGDVVFDGFCGSGMTGVAAQLCGDRKAVEALGYYVDEKGTIYDKPAAQAGSAANKPISRLGARKAVLNDLSPAATFIAYNYNTPVDTAAFEVEAKRILDEVEKELGWMYETWHPHCDDLNRVRGNVIYTLWSDVFICNECSNEIVFWDAAIDPEAGKVLDSFNCPACGSLVSKRELDRAVDTIFDTYTSQTVKRAKQEPTLIIYEVGKQRFEKQPDTWDIQLLKKIEAKTTSNYFPTNRIDKDIDLWYERDYRSLGVFSVDAFYSDRNLQIMAELWEKISHSEITALRFAFTGITRDVSKLTGIDVRKYFKGGGGPFAGGVKGTLYIPSLLVEKNIFFAYRNRVKRLKGALNQTSKNNLSQIVTTQSHTALNNVSSNTFDYVFTDPPFGDNIIYSDLSIIWESWLRVYTQTHKEAVIHRRKKYNPGTLDTYSNLLVDSFKEAYRLLKPGRWVTVEFHNTRSSVWNAIQEAILRAGFVIADVRTLDKKQGTFKQVTAAGSVKQDLVISAYKPQSGFELRFLSEGGSTKGAWDFVVQHLEQLPVVVEKEGVLEIINERQDYLLYDRMVAFHVQRGLSVPLSAPEFYDGLRQRFAKRHGMFFLSEQVPQYDRASLSAERVAQLSFFVSDEKSAIQWLRQQLDPETSGQAQSYQQIQPQFLRQLHQAPHEALPELSVMLEENFLQDETGKWYVPDPNKESDLQKWRLKALLREFKEYVGGNGRLRQFRTEAIRAGFAAAYQEKEYATIIQVSNRLPERVLQEDLNLLMYYDNASLRM